MNSEDPAGRKKNSLKKQTFSKDLRARRGSTDRTHRLAWDAATLMSGICTERDAVLQAYAAPKGSSPMLGAAHQFQFIYSNLTPVIRESEIIIGGFLQSDDEPGWGWVPDGTKDYVDDLANNAPPSRPDLKEKALRGLYSPVTSLNHKVPDYAGYIRTGSNALAERAREISKLRRGEQRDFALAFANGHDTMAAIATA